MDNPFNDVPETGRVIGNFSGGIASAIACYYALEKYSNVHLSFMDTGIEHPDTYALIKQFEEKTGEKIHLYRSKSFDSPAAVMRKYAGMNFVHGAPCSMALKQRVAKEQVKNKHTDHGEIFGFDVTEKKRAKSLIVNNPDINVITPLIDKGLTKIDCFDIANELGLLVPSPYKHFLNNNCLGADDSPIGGCVQGGIGYWQKMKLVYPLKYDNMANLEHEITDIRYEKFKKEGRLEDFEVVTICKSQAKATKGDRLYLKHNPKYPHIKTIDSVNGRQPVTVFECGINCNLQLQ